MFLFCCNKQFLFVSRQRMYWWNLYGMLRNVYLYRPIDYSSKDKTNIFFSPKAGNRMFLRLLQHLYKRNIQKRIHWSMALILNKKLFYGIVSKMHQFFIKPIFCSHQTLTAKPQRSRCWHYVKEKIFITVWVVLLLKMTNHRLYWNWGIKNGKVFINQSQFYFLHFNGRTLWSLGHIIDVNGLYRKLVHLRRM